VLVDNVPEGHPDLATPRCRKKARSFSMETKAAWPALIMRVVPYRQQWPDTTHVLFLDDDTDVSAMGRFLDSQITREAAADPTIAGVAPIHKDRAPK